MTKFIVHKIKFIVYRTSDWKGGGPIEEAKLEEELEVSFTHDRTAHTIELSTLEELLGLVKKYGSIIISTDNEIDYPILEIYDDYR